MGSSDGNLYAVNPDGTEMWSFATGYHGLGSSPAIAPDGTIYFGGSYDSVFALNPDGSLKWRFPTQGGVESSPVTGPDGTVYVGSYDDFVYAINPDGSLKWKFQSGSSIYSSPAIGPDGTVYIGSIDEHLYAFGPNGNLKWVYPQWGAPTYGPIVSSPSVGRDGTVFVGAEYAPFMAINQNGSLRWRAFTGGNIYSSAAIAQDGTTYVGNGNGSLFAVNADGTRRWAFTTSGYVVSSPSLDADGVIYFGSYDGSLYAVNPDGNLMWRFGIGQPVASSPAIGRDGTIYFGSFDGSLYSVGSPSGVSSSTSNASTTTTTVTTSQPSRCSSASSGFASVQNATLMLGGRPFRFIGANEPNLLAEYLGLPFPPGTHPPNPESVFLDAAASGMCVVKFSLEAGAQFTGYGLPGYGRNPVNGGGSHTFDLFWSLYSKEPDHATYFRALDALISDARRYGVHVIPILSIAFMGWGRLGNDTDLYKVNSTANNTWNGFVASVVSRYRNETQILWWDMGDEVNNLVGVTPGQFPPQFQDQAYSRPISELVQWANDSYDRIKSIDHNHLVEVDWNLPWDGFYGLYGSSAPQMIRLEYKSMAVFRVLEAKTDVAALHTYDSDIKAVLSQVIYNSTDYRNITSEFVRHYAEYAHDVLKKPLEFGEWDATTWANYWLRIGYSPNPYIAWFLQDLVNYSVDGALIWPFEDGSDYYHVSPRETPEVTNWLMYYSGLLAASSNHTTTSLTATTSSTTSTTASLSSSASKSTSGVPPTSTSQTVTGSSSSTSPGGGGIPEFPNQLIALVVFTALVIIPYLFFKRRKQASRLPPSGTAR